MSFWVEVRCSVMGPSTGFGPYQHCHSADNSGPGLLVAASQKHVAEAVRRLTARAQKLGWKKVGGRWVCPHCASLSDVLEDSLGDEEDEND